MSDENDEQEEILTFPEFIELMGKKHKTKRPSFGVREALIMAWGKSSISSSDPRWLWIRAAGVGLCTGLAGGASLSDHDYSVIGYGQAVYSWLREAKEVSTDDVSAAGSLLIAGLTNEMFPSAKEVDAAKGFSEGTGEPG